MFDTEFDFSGTNFTILSSERASELLAATATQNMLHQIDTSNSWNFR